MNLDSNLQKQVTYDDIMVMLNQKRSTQMIETIENKSFQDINLKNDDSILMRACQVGDVESVRYLLAHGADLSFESHYSGHNALSLACLHGHESVVKLLLEQGVDPNLPRGQLPLVMACRSGHVKIVELLLDSEADINKTPMFEIDDSDARAVDSDWMPNTRYRYGPNALMTACFYGHIDLVRLLLQRGANAGAILEFNEDEYQGMTPLTFASKAGHWDIVKLLIEVVEAAAEEEGEEGSEEEKDEEGEVEEEEPSEEASNDEHGDGHGVAIDWVSKWCVASTPLMHTCAQGNLEVAKMLLDLGADINKTIVGLHEKYADSPLLSACLHGRVEVVQFILDHDTFDPSRNAFDHAFIEAYENGSSEVIALLQSRITGGPGFLDRMLIESCKAGRAKTAKTLLAMGAAVDATGTSGRTALMEACANERSVVELITLLVEHGADVNKVDSKGNAALHIACDTSKAYEAGKLLLEYGADVTIKNNAGKDVFDMMNEIRNKYESARAGPFYRLCEKFKESNRRDREPGEVQLK